MVKTLSKTISFYIGVLSMFVGGIIFVLMSDLTFSNSADNLIISVLLCFGSAIIFFFANDYMEKPWAMYLMKGIGLALAVGLIIYYHLFSQGDFYLAAVEKLRRAGIKDAGRYQAALASIPVVLALSCLAMVAQAVNIVLTATLGEDIVKKDQPQAETAEEAVADTPAETGPAQE